ncbi:hypothetical protein IC615_15600 [Serratia ureilytica]
MQSAGLQARPIGIDEQGLDVGQLMQASGAGGAFTSRRPIITRWDTR